MYAGDVGHDEVTRSRFMSVEDVQVIGHILARRASVILVFPPVLAQFGEVMETRGLG